MNLLLKEYLSAGDKEEVLRCLNELEVPHFHHELVYEAIVMVLENSDVLCADMMCALLQYMAKVMIITPDQFKKASSLSCFVKDKAFDSTLVLFCSPGFHACVPRPD